MAEKYRKEVCEIISEMLDNPDEYGIYPTSKCYNRLISYISEVEKDAVKGFAGFMNKWFDDNNMGIQIYNNRIGEYLKGKDVKSDIPAGHKVPFGSSDIIMKPLYHNGSAEQDEKGQEPNYMIRSKYTDAMEELCKPDKPRNSEPAKKRGLNNEEKYAKSHQHFTDTTEAESLKDETNPDTYVKPSPDIGKIRDEEYAKGYKNGYSDGLANFNSSFSFKESALKEEELIELIKDTFSKHGVKQKEDGRIVTYFTPDSASDFVVFLTEKLLPYLDTATIKEVCDGIRDFKRWWNNFPNVTYKIADDDIDEFEQYLTEKGRR